MPSCYRLFETILYFVVLGYVFHSVNFSVGLSYFGELVIKLTIVVCINCFNINIKQDLFGSYH